MHLGLYNQKVCQDYSPTIIVYFWDEIFISLNQQEIFVDKYIGQYKDSPSNHKLLQN